ncbi:MULTISPECIES: succinyl-diaminopimelate desuccinylase [unclassified Chelatococcus]|uniref:succinyl-diaminopimelate desuccinylase n=1 Tax=unclassified Chelatococcus TaxID=2638111 RepID=UPI001BCD65F9|nr:MULTISPECIES: succinyl-diaminopimelate desuccinylase [unclassified Chelatococcus]MBS7697516.1 succinyl-diaminopimelate desuccinylase [Chelatococcus sp. YT9]MBX3559409.1 succinyl-diaminopimelate desuccinylase [Chelatococcus sp.]
MHPVSDPPPAELSPAVALALDLIRCRSVTPDEGGALALLDQKLSEVGFATHRLTFTAPDTPDVENLYARYGREAPFLLFAGHTDVVPPGDEAHWRHDPFAGVIEDGRIFGRGASDMKGGVAAMVAASLAFIRANPRFPGSIGFLLTGDEEGPAINGTVKLLEWVKNELGDKFDHCILAEPTNPEALGDMIKIGRRGSLSGRIVLAGKQGHVAYPQLADNPIQYLGALIAALKDKPLDGGTEHFAPSNLEFTTIDVANPSGNVIPAEVRLAFNIRFNDRWTPETLADEIRDRIAAADLGERASVTFLPTNATAFVTEPGPLVSALSRAIEAETGLKPVLSTTGGTSDARFIKDYCSVVEFGLVGQTMHQVDENVAVADIDALTSIFRRVLQDYFPPSSR